MDPQSQGRLSGGMFELPGGYQPRSGAPVARSVTPSELSGNVELAVSEALDCPSKPEAVSRILGQLISKIGRTRANSKMISDWSVADRTYALIQLGLALGFSQQWCSATCHACDERFDVSFDLTAIKVSARPETFPEIRFETSLGPMVLKAPTGTDQLAIADIETIDEACHQLLARCLRHASGEAVNLPALNEEEVERIGAAFDQLALGVPLNGEASCPKCEAETTVPFEPLEWVSRMAGDLLDQVHEIASYYHWPESEILELPRQRRLSYLRRLGYFDEVSQR